MRSCPACGTANREDDDFCGNCGAYLGWSTEARRTPAAREPEPAPAPRPEPEAAAGPAAPRPAPEPEAAEAPEAPALEAPETPAAGPAIPASPAAAQPSVPPRPATAPTPPAPPTPPPQLPPSAPPSTAPTAARTTPVPPQPTSAPPQQPRHPAPAPVRPAVPQPPEEAPIGAVQPARPVARRPVVRPVEADEAVEGEPCPACGTPNAPGRRFCRRCAAPLRAKAETAPLPWWRTVWPFRRRVRLRSGRALRRILLVLAVVGLLFVGFLFLPAGRVLFEDVRDKLGGTAEISPSGVTASAEAPGHPAGAAVDGLTNKYWGAPALGASLTATFGTPFRLVGVVLHTGASTEPEEFRREPRPVGADLIVTTADGTVHEKELTLNDKPGEQTVRTGISDVVSVRLVLREAVGESKGRPIALGEIEFFKRT
ncbi:zinc ribbon domain-containing protein [Streptomyces cavourensis]|uniref:zinc ribbon domain-containing protein n=1 Tax=Streptomyces cavourensis TaxID=67258 RepID=UPI000DC65D8D|nr:zinc ribbon domain-containing protein [Streptomyces cavourensis]ATY98274.1 zinc ribbon domain-containing protein [Streptomyces cavourensis]